MLCIFVTLRVLFLLYGAESRAAVGKAGFGMYSSVSVGTVGANRVVIKRRSVWCLSCVVWAKVPELSGSMTYIAFVVLRLVTVMGPPVLRADEKSRPGHASKM